MGATVSVNSELDIDQARREMGKRFTPEVEDRFYEIMDENGRVTMEDFKRVFPNMYKQKEKRFYINIYNQFLNNLCYLQIL